MSEKFTSGPWEIWDGAYIRTVPIPSTERNLSGVPPHGICKMMGGTDHDATLIAAAPEMYEALQIAYAHISPAMQPTIYDTISAALAKARGQL